MKYAADIEERLSVQVVASQEEVPDFGKDVLAGLSKRPKSLPFLYLYDAAGSLIFEEICEVPEYYLTRTENEILKRFASQIADYSKGGMALVELGSGSSLKTRRLIEALLRKQGRLHYLPVDISRTMLVDSSRKLLEEYPSLRVSAYAAEYKSGVCRLSKIGADQKMVLFLGSNIGNFEPWAAQDFLSLVRANLNEGDLFLVGTDMQKDRSVLEAAYDDSQGVTARFIKNILSRVNRELDGEFDLDTFDYVAFYNPGYTRVEIHLQSTRAQDVRVGALRESFHFSPGESIHIENSYKYSLDQIEEISAEARFSVVKRWQDEMQYFSLNLLAPR